MRKTTLLFAITAVVACLMVLITSCSNDGQLPVTYSIDTTTDGHGTAMADKTSAQEGETISITAVPDSGFTFGKWVIHSDGVVLSDIESPIATFIMPANNVLIAAEFEAIPPDTYTITLDTDGNGTAKATVNGAEVKFSEAGVTITLTATPNGGCSFKQWVTDDIVLQERESAVVTFTMPAANVSVRAEFNIPGAEYGIETVKIPAGTFLMGSPETEPTRQSVEEQQHRVTLSRDFYMAKYPITNTQYAEFLNENNITTTAANTYVMYQFNDRCVKWDSELGKWVPDTGFDDHPVVMVTWNGAKAYADWIGGALPTEAQWEYACRGGQTESLPFGIGDGTKLTYGMANFLISRSYDLSKGGEYSDQENHDLYYTEDTCPVGSYPYPNGYGLYDMHGNTFEWCSDWYHVYYGLSEEELAGTVVDPIGPPDNSGSFVRVYRGGTAGNAAGWCRSAYRSSRSPGASSDMTGFRVIFQ